MALVRILIDGYNLIHAYCEYVNTLRNTKSNLPHSWPELAPGRARHSEAAREELILRLTLYQDAAGTPITIFFDGGGAPKGTPKAHSRPEVEVLFSRSGQTADQMIERAAYRFKAYGEVLAVTNDVAERETVIAMGGLASSCLNFIQTVESTLGEVADDVKDYNLKERNRFNRRRA